MTQDKSFFGIEKEPNLDDFLRMGDVASQIRHLQEEVGKQLDIDQKKAVLRKTLLKSAKERGEKLIPEQIDVAIDSFYSDRYSFKEPRKNFGTTLANLYITRKKIAVVAGTLAAITTLSWITTTAISSAHKASLERGVESTIEKEYRERVELGEKLKVIVSSPFRKQLPQNEQDKLTANITTSEGRLKESDKILDNYCPKGSAKKAVTQKNFDEVKKQIPVLESILIPVGSQINEGVKIIETQKQFVSTKQSLDSLIGEIRNSKPLPVLLQKAETTYSNGTTCIDNRQLPDAQNYQKQLTTLKQDLVSFSSLTENIEKLYSNIKAVAKEDKAKVTGEKLYQEAKQFEQAVDITRLRQSAAQLENLDEVLNQEYTLKIGQDSAGKSGIDRYYEGKFSGWYIFVEAIDKRTGRAIPMSITNCENGRTEKVALWGQKVDEKDPDVVGKIKEGRYNSNSVLQRIIKDKLDDGVVNNNVIGRKEKGYLNHKINVDGFLGEQITRW